MRPRKRARQVLERRKKIVIDGPFAETKELIAGYWMWRVKSKQKSTGSSVRLSKTR